MKIKVIAYWFLWEVKFFFTWELIIISFQNNSLNKSLCLYALNIISLSKFVLWQLHFVCCEGKRKLVGSGRSSCYCYCCIKCIERSEFLIFLMEFILPRYIYTLETIMLYSLSQQKRNMYFAQTHIRGNSIIITIIILRLLQLLSSFGENAKVFMRIFFVAHIDV